MSDSAIDMKELNEIMDDDLELIQECFSDYLQDFPDIINEIETAVNQKVFDRVDAAAHKLKGVLLYIAAPDAARAAKAIEFAGKDRDLAQIDTQLAFLKSECRKVAEFIDHFNDGQAPV